MIEASDLRMTRIPLNRGAGHMPALGFGTLIPDAVVTITATRDALEAGFRHFDCAERYGNEREVGRALQAGLAAGGIAARPLCCAPSRGGVHDKHLLVPLAGAAGISAVHMAPTALR